MSRLVLAALALATGAVLAPWSATVAAAATVADPATALPAGATGDIVVDDAASRVFIAQPGNNAVVVADRGGTVTGTLTGIPAATWLVSRPASHTLYVAGRSGTTITKVNTRTLQQTTIALPASVCTDSLTYTGGRLWFSFDTCPAGSTWGLGYVDPATGAVTTFPTRVGYPDLMTALPAQPGRVVGFEAGFSGVSLDIWDLTTAPPTLVTSAYPSGTPLSNCVQAAYLNRGAQVVLACGAPYEHRVFNTSDGSYVTSMPSNPYPDAVATNRSGTRVALGMDGIYDPDVIVQDISAGLPGTAVASYDFGYARSLADRGLAWSAGGLIYAIEAGDYSTNTPILHILDPGSASS